MKISLIAVDLDGTLLSTKSELSKRNIDAIRRLSEKGIITVPVTGRTYNEIPQLIRNDENIKHFVFSNGSGIYEKGRGVISSSFIPCDIAGKILALLKSYETYIEIYSGGYPWSEASKLCEEKFDYYRINPVFRKVIKHSRKQVNDFTPLVSNQSLKPELFNAFFRDMKEREACLDKFLSLFPDEEIVSSMGNNLEIMNKGTNKGTALSKLCKLMNVNPKEVLALGDSKNDLAMFEFAGVSYAVENANEELKKKANGVICSNDNHIMEYVEKNIL